MRLFLLLALLLPGTALAQTTGSLSGTLSDDTGEALPGATVFIPQIQRGAASDIDGNYTISWIPVGVYEIQFSSVGFQPQSIEDVRISRDRTRTLHVSLTVGQELETVVLDGGCDPFWRGFRSSYHIRVRCREQIENQPDRFTSGVGLALTSVYSR